MGWIRKRGELGGGDKGNVVVEGGNGFLKGVDLRGEEGGLVYPPLKWVEREFVRLKVEALASGLWG